MVVQAAFRAVHVLRDHVRTDQFLEALGHVLRALVRGADLLAARGKLLLLLLVQDLRAAGFRLAENLVAVLFRLVLLRAAGLRLAEDLRAAGLRGVLLRAVGLRFAFLRAVLLRAAGLREVLLRAVLLRALVVRLAADFGLRPEVFLALGLRVADLVVRRALVRLLLVLVGIESTPVCRRRVMPPGVLPCVPRPPHHAAISRGQHLGSTHGRWQISPMSEKQQKFLRGALQMRGGSGRAAALAKRSGQPPGPLWGLRAAEIAAAGDSAYRTRRLAFLPTGNRPQTR